VKRFDYYLSGNEKNIKTADTYYAMFIYSYIHYTVLFQKVLYEFSSILEQDNYSYYKMFPSDMYLYQPYNNMELLVQT